MFSSLASFLFGSNTSCESNNYTELEREKNEYLPIPSETHCDKDFKVNENGEPASEARKKNLEKEFQQERGKCKRNNRKNKNKEGQTRTLEHGKKYGSPDDDFDLSENDWFFVQEEDVDTTHSKPRESLDLDATSIRASTPVIEVLTTPKLEVKTIKPQKIKKDSQQVRNSNRQKRNQNSKTGNINARSYSITSCNKACTSSLSPSRSYPGDWAGNGAVELKALADADITQSLYIVPGRQESGHNVSGASCDSNSSGARLFTMVDSWYLTPPPCFTSNGPIHMEISPLENLLIEHPSMSVYHSIRPSQNAFESFVDFDLEINKSKGIQMNHKNAKALPNRQKNKNDKENAETERSSKQKSMTTKVITPSMDQNTRIAVEGRAPGPRIDRYTAAQLKMQLFAWNGQKSQANLNHQNLRRGAILRSNKVRDIQSKGNRQRRADMQNCRLNSGVNNNRKCCY